MIYPEVPLKVWLKRYPELKVISGTCSNCEKIMPTSRPFLSKGYAGIESLPCSCGKNRNKAMTMVTITAAAHAEWVDLLGGT